MMTNIPDVSCFRRPPVLLPPMTRQVESRVSTKKMSSHAKTGATQKSTVKVDQSAVEKEKEDLVR